MLCCSGALRRRSLLQIRMDCDFREDHEGIPVSRRLHDMNAEWPVSICCIRGDSHDTQICGNAPKFGHQIAIWIDTSMVECNATTLKEVLDSNSGEAVGK